MEDRRQHSRHPTGLLLEVFDLHSAERLGRVVDLSEDGFMLLSEHALQTDMLYECRLVPSETLVSMGAVSFVADCLWSRAGADEQRCWAGFHIIDIAEDQAALLRALLEHI